MALNQSDMTMQRLAMAVGQLSEQLQISQTTKSDFKLEDVVKALNLTFKTSKNDTGELKTLMKIAKSTPNAEHYMKLTKAIEILLKTYDNPDTKQMSRLGISAQNIVSEIKSLRDELSNTNLKGNDKANLSVLSKAIAEGNRLYAVNGAGRDASNFYKKATLEQLTLLRLVNKHIEEGIPLKDMKKKGIGESLKRGAKGVLGSGPLLAATDAVLKGMGFGTLPGEFLDMFASKKKEGEDEKLSKKEQLQAMKIEEIVTAKEKSQASLDANEMIQKRAIEVKNTASATKENLKVDLSKSLADLMQLTGVDSKYADENNATVADPEKIAKAIESKELDKGYIEELVKFASEKSDGNEAFSKETLDTILKNVEEVHEYAKIVDEQDKIIKNTAESIQTSIDTISQLFLDLREVLGKELTAEIKELNKIFDKSPEFRKMDKDERENKKQEAILLKLSKIAERSNITEDEMHGLIGGEDKSNYMKKFEEQGKHTDRKTGSELAKAAFEERTFRDALLGRAEEPKVKEPNVMGDEFEEKVRATTLRREKAPPPTPIQATEAEVPVAPSPRRDEVEVQNDQISLDEMAEIMNESITEFLKNFDEAMKERDKESKAQMDILKKSLMSGEMKVKVTNLNEIPSSGGFGGGQQGGHGNTKASKFGDEGASVIP